MGNCTTYICSDQATRVQVIANREIEKVIYAEREKMDMTIKLLLLGGSDSGKTTILKQMRILHNGGFTAAEYEYWGQIVIRNIMSEMNLILKAMRSKSIPFEKAQRLVSALSWSNSCPAASTGHFQADAEIFQEMMNKNDNGSRSSVDSDDSLLNENVKRSLQALWADKNVQKVFQTDNDFHINRSAKYFFNNLERIWDHNYSPQVNDILHARVQTQGVVEVCFPMKGLNFRVFDVSGQRSKRKKWIHLFDDVNAVVFVTSLSEYDQTLFEDMFANRMRDSLNLFKSVGNNHWFKNAAMIVFFNKKDIFEEKIKKTSIRVAFPQYEGKQDYESCLKFIEKEFFKVVEDREAGIYPHRTCATDTNHMDGILENILSMIINQNLKNARFH